ncbi:MAG: nucleotidyltransferase domain-containing protein [Candidatus Micrarchaeota archaeon]
MNIHTLLSTQERERILGYLLEHSSESINLTKIAREVKVSPAQVHKYVGILREQKHVSGNRMIELPVTSALRLLLNLKKIQEARVVEMLRKHFPKAMGIGLYGSWANGTNTENADLDIWIKLNSEPSDLDASAAKNELRKKLGIPIDIVFATPERLENFRKKSDAFYFSLYCGKILWGENL